MFRHNERYNEMIEVQCEMCRYRAFCRNTMKYEDIMIDIDILFNGRCRNMQSHKEKCRGSAGPSTSRRRFFCNQHPSATRPPLINPTLISDRVFNSPIVDHPVTAKPHVTGGVRLHLCINPLCNIHIYLLFEINSRKNLLNHNIS